MSSLLRLQTNTTAPENWLSFTSIKSKEVETLGRKLQLLKFQMTRLKIAIRIRVYI